MLMFKPVRNCTQNWKRNLQVALGLLVGKGNGSSSRPVCVVQTVMTDGHGALVDGS